MTEADKILENVCVGDIKHLDSTPPDGARPTSVMTLEATVEVRPQQLQSIRPYYLAAKNVPPELSNEAKIVLHAFFSCFDKQKSVHEGLIGDVIWGFEQARIPAECTVAGLKELHKAGYVKFQAPDNTYVDLSSDKAGQAWVRFQPKLLEMVYESPSSK